MKNEKGLRSTNLVITNSHRNIKYSAGTIVNNVVITMYGARWALELSEDHFVNYIIV